MLTIPSVCHKSANKRKNAKKDEPLRASAPPSRVNEWMSVFETVALCLREKLLLLLPQFPSHPPPQNIGSALTLLNQSGIFNCACFWVSFASAHSTHVQSRRHSSAGNTLTSTYGVLLFPPALDMLAAYGWVEGVYVPCYIRICVCVCVSVCTCARVAMCVSADVHVDLGQSLFSTAV